MPNILRKEPRLCAVWFESMKKLLACILCVLMVCTMSSLFMTSASAAESNDLLKTYAEAADGDLLYHVKFGQSSGCYVSQEFARDPASTATVTVSDDGNEVVVSVAAATSKKLWYGGLVEGLELGDGNKYTITFKIKSDNADPNSTGNNGFFFNSDDACSTYADSYGFYGNLTAASGPFLSLFKGGSKTFGDIISDGTNYFKTMDLFGMNPDADADGFCDVAVEIDGYSYTVYLNGGKVKFDTTTLSESSVVLADRFAIIFYTYSSGGAMKDVNIYKGNIITSPVTTTSAPTTTAAPVTTAAPTDTTKAPDVTPSTSDSTMMVIGIAMMVAAIATSAFVVKGKKRT